MQNLRFILTIIFFTISLNLAWGGEVPDLESLSKAYLKAIEATNQEDVGDETRDALFAFYAEDISFTHVKFDMTIKPKEVLRSQSEQFAGWNRNATLTLENIITGNNVAILKIHRKGEQKDMEGNWNEIDIINVMVLEFEGDKIKKVRNY